ncbi:methyltransferase family protein [Murinocardiopsis flavida]|uniref:Methyltransferase family protein n=1 Tax=Murinocardiopsis flavida TaxID=645275 RepID=A0A2P8DIV1_9ACTN|nr:class I SAM-dependent methyltransferase [Murinocardiopsis flavida]PSK97157.1 methyltransferase family protein [Murinocardiopsis flavida]
MTRIDWTEAGEQRSAQWRSESRTPPPVRVVVADDRMKADTAYRLATKGTALLWRGDFHNARQLLSAVARRCDRSSRPKGGTPAEGFAAHRRARARRARTLGMLLVELAPDHSVALRRAPDTRRACARVFGDARDGQGGQDGQDGQDGSVIAISELLGLLSADEWRRKGVAVPALDARVHAHYGVFSPVRGEYVDLVAQAPLPGQRGGAAGRPRVAFDIGTGTGVLAAVLARRGVGRVVATDTDPRALACAAENIDRLGYAEQVATVAADLFPEGRASLIVCNPPWVPADPTSPIERGVYDPESRMLHGFLAGLPEHLDEGGEGWLILSDFAEHLGLRSRSELTDAFDAAGLAVAGTLDTRPRHPRASDPSDPLHAARAAEVTTLWRLRPRAGSGHAEDHAEDHTENRGENRAEGHTE